MSLGPAELHRLAMGAGFSRDQARTMAAIALGESGGDPNAVGDRNLVSGTWGPSIGLWQIRSLNAQRGTGQERDATRLTDPAFNARSARTIYSQQGYRAWTVYTSGAYGKHLAAVDAALAGGGGGVSGAVGGVLGAPLGPVGGLVGSKLGVDGIGGAVVGGGKAALNGLDAVGAFAGALTDRGTWVRVLQVVGGAGMVAGGLLLLGRDVITPVASTAADFVPAARAVKAAGGVAKATGAAKAGVKAAGAAKAGAKAATS